MLETIQGWFREAVALHGDDWPKIESYVAKKMAAISETERSRLHDEFSAMSGSEASSVN